MLLEEKCKQLLGEIITEIREFIFSEQTKVESRLKPQYFTRNRKMPFPYLLIFSLADLIGSLDSELQAFFRTISDTGNLLSEAAFSKARSHISEEPFRKMFEMVRDRFVSFEKQEMPQRFHQMLWCGVDGSFLTLPNFPFLATEFGTMGKYHSSPTARMGLVYDSLSHFIYEGELAPLSFNERILALKCLNRLKNLIDLPKTVFIFDRGYTGINFIKELEELKTNFIIRLRETFHGIEELDYETITTVYFPDHEPLRVAKFFLSSENPETLITNLSWPGLKDLKELYWLRWPVEIAFYFIKRVLRLEDFNGYSILSIKQNFWISLTLSNIASIVKLGADAAITEQRKNKHNKYQYESNLSEVMTDLHYLIIKALITEEEKKRERCIEEMFEKAKHYVTPIRKDRKVSRNFTRTAFNHFNQKVH